MPCKDLARSKCSAHGNKALCCGAGSARFYMEETIGKRVSHEHIDEALDLVSTACHSAW
jgi:Fe-S oxidoreductase